MKKSPDNPTTPGQTGTPAPHRLSGGDVLILQGMGETKQSVESLRRELQIMRNQAEKDLARIEAKQKETSEDIKGLNKQVAKINYWNIGVAASVAAIAGFVALIYTVLRDMIPLIVEAIKLVDG